ncbi:MAG TPA: Ppx/GppA phosphatase family protein [Bdellovibrionota bacterium]|jgi:exopolyphosphatase/guanosine-5'-triphosphate,3'-diphosphate pyrophosphatase
MLKAGIDIGTNTILLLIAEVEGGRVVKVLEDHVRVVRLGQAVDKNRVFHPEAMERAMACFRDYAQVLKRYPGIDVRAVATSGSRDARNSGEFFVQVKKETGISIRVISGEEEALLSFRGALVDPGKSAGVAVLDIGGGSTEIVGLEQGSDSRLFRFSFDMGCVRLTERFLPGDPPKDSQIQELRAFVKAELGKQKKLVDGLRGRQLVGVAGTATYLASSFLGLKAFDPDRVQGTSVSLADIQKLIQRFQGMTSADRLGVGGMDKGRADVIVAGALILEEVLLAAQLKDLTTSVRGLRYGAVLVDL